MNGRKVCRLDREEMAVIYRDQGEDETPKGQTRVEEVRVAGTLDQMTSSGCGATATLTSGNSSKSTGTRLTLACTLREEACAYALDRL